MAGFITKESKPGRGVSKDEPEKRRLFVFFEILGSKIGKLTQLNLIYTLAIFPLLFGLYFSLELNRNLTSISDIFKIPVFKIAPDYISLIILAVSLFITGPATAGFTYVIRNMQRREHAWVLSDFWEHFRKNFKQGFIMSVVDLVGYTLLYVAYYFYVYVAPVDMPQMGSAMPNIAAGLIIAVTVIFTWAHFYIYTMMVTFELKFSKLFKNAVIFAIGKLPLNIFITIIVGAVLAGCLYLFVLSPMVLAIIAGLILFSLIGLIVVFSTYPTIDKLMLKRVSENKERVLKY
ncbi:MAG: DUF624 domain-containing protein [Ruminococcaceae bacterium]|nr:DUF624 domain-containing protein [Oscillospiraceae bacterium]